MSIAWVNKTKAEIKAQLSASLARHFPSFVYGTSRNDERADHTLAARSFNSSHAYQSPQDPSANREKNTSAPLEPGRIEAYSFHADSPRPCASKYLSNSHQRASSRIHPPSSVEQLSQSHHRLSIVEEKTASKGQLAPAHDARLTEERSGIIEPSSFTRVPSLVPPSTLWEAQSPRRANQTESLNENFDGFHPLDLTIDAPTMSPDSSHQLDMLDEDAAEDRAYVVPALQSRRSQQQGVSEISNPLEFEPQAGLGQTSLRQSLEADRHSLQTTHNCSNAKISTQLHELGPHQHDGFRAGEVEASHGPQTKSTRDLSYLPSMQQLSPDDILHSSNHDSGSRTDSSLGSFTLVSSPISDGDTDIEILRSPAAVLKENVNLKRSSSSPSRGLSQSDHLEPYSEDETTSKQPKRRKTNWPTSNSVAKGLLSPRMDSHISPSLRESITAPSPQPERWFDAIFYSLSQKSSDSSAQATLTVQKNRLPHDWARETDSIGRPFFIHKKTGKTLWNAPRETTPVQSTSTSASYDENEDIIFVSPTSSKISTKHPETSTVQHLQSCISDTQTERYMILTGLAEESYVEDLVRYVKTAQDPHPQHNRSRNSLSKHKPELPLNILCNLSARGYPPSLWDLKRDRPYSVPRRVNHGCKSARFLMVEYATSAGRESSYSIFKNTDPEREFFSKPVAAHRLHDFQDLEDCECIYSSDPSIPTCIITRAEFRQLIETFLSFAQDRRDDNMKPVWQELSEDVIKSRFLQILKKNSQKAPEDAFGAYLERAQNSAVLIRSSVRSRGLHLDSPATPTERWKLSKPFRKQLKD